MKRRTLLIVLAAAALLLQPTHGPGCGPFPQVAIFSFRSHPLLPWKAYLAGRLGVVQPTYWRKFLFVAWRALAGRPLSSAQQAALAGSEDAGSRTLDLDPAPLETPGPDVWVRARSAVRPAAGYQTPEVYAPVPGSQYESYENCLAGAFAAAARTLEDRVKRFGAADTAVGAWVDAQDAVFTTCGGKKAVAPQPAAPSLPAWARQDRQYQVAAALFYAGRFPEARRQFAQIADDSASPWRATARYMVARTYIRQATVTAGQKPPDPGLLKQAAAELESVIKAGDMAALHDAARGLLHFVEARLDPAGRLATVAKLLETTGDEAGVSQDLVDFRLLMDRFAEMDAAAQARIRGTSELIDWIASIQGKEGAFEHALGRWRDTKSEAWLVAAMTKAGARENAAQDLIEAAARLAPASPAYPTALYHRIRLLAGSKRASDARELIDRELPRLRREQAIPTVNLFLAERMELARNLAEFLAFAPRRALGVATFGDWDMEPFEGARPGTTRTLFDADSVEVFNRGLPLSMLREAALGSTLPASLRPRLVLIAWARAAILGDEAAAEALAPAFEKTWPKTGPYLERYRKAAPGAARKFAAADLMLHFPGIKPFLFSGVNMRLKLEGIDDFRDNWWCAARGPNLTDPPIQQLWEQFDKEKTLPAGGALPGPFLSAAERSTLAAEWSKLVQAHAGSTWLGAAAVEWARANPGDARVPEALHLSVRASRYGCNDAQTGAWSHRAFDLLHQRYPASRWTQATPLWFK
jgi:hypothetical protein